MVLDGVLISSHGPSAHGFLIVILVIVDWRIVRISRHNVKRCSRECADNH